MSKSSEIEALSERAEGVAEHLGLLANPSRLHLPCCLVQGDAAIGALWSLRPIKRAKGFR